MESSAVTEAALASPVVPTPASDVLSTASGQATGVSKGHDASEMALLPTKDHTDDDDAALTADRERPSAPDTPPGADHGIGNGLEKQASEQKEQAAAAAAAQGTTGGASSPGESRFSRHRQIASKLAAVAAAESTRTTFG